MYDHYDIYVNKRDYKGDSFVQITVNHQEFGCIDLMLTHAEAVEVAREMVAAINSISPTSQS